MIGFFEHQYFTYKKNHLRNLLALAKADGHMHEKEEKLLYKIGKRYGLKEKQVKKVIDSEEKFSVNIPDNHNDKMNLLHDLVWMVHADEKIEKSEIEFCEEVVKQFGMKEGLVKWMIKKFDKGTPPPLEEWDEIKEEALKKFAE